MPAQTRATCPIVLFIAFHIQLNKINADTPNMKETFNITLLTMAGYMLIQVCNNQKDDPKNSE